MVVQPRVLLVGLALISLAGCAGQSVKKAAIDKNEPVQVLAIEEANTLVISGDTGRQTIRLAGIKRTGFEIRCHDCEKAGKEKCEHCLEPEKATGRHEDSLPHCTDKVRSYRNQTARDFAEKLVNQEKILIYTAEARGKAEARAWVYRAKDQLLVNYALVRMGYALVADQVEKKYLPSMLQAQTRAQAQKLGLWAAPLPPENEPKPQALTPLAADQDLIVFVSGGEKQFHQETHAVLGEAAYPMEVKQAEQGGYRACPVCFLKKP